MSKTLYHIKRKVWLTQSANGVPNVNMPYGGFNADFTAYKGINNAFEFYIKNLDRKPILLNGKSLTIRFFANDTGQFILELPLEVVDPTRGLVRVVLTKTDIAMWPNIIVRYSVEMTGDDGITTILHADQSHDARGYIRVSDSHIGTPTPVYEALISEFYPVDACFVSESWPGSDRYRFSDNMITIAVTMTDFTGTLQVQASLAENPGSGWFDVNLGSSPITPYAACTGTEAYSIEGNYQWIRVVVCPNVANTGTFDKVSIRV